MNKGCLVKLRHSSSRSIMTNSDAHGLTLSEPEMFGFIQRVHVMWPSETSSMISLEEWIDLEDIVVLGDSESD